MNSESNGWCPYKRTEREIQTQRERPISASLVDAEIVVVQPQAKERQGLPVTPEAGREAWKRFPQREPTLPTPGFQTSGFQNYERIKFCCLSHPVGGNLSQKPQETNKMPFCVVGFFLN